MKPPQEVFSALSVPTTYNRQSTVAATALLKTMGLHFKVSEWSWWKYQPWWWRKGIMCAKPFISHSTRSERVRKDLRVRHNHPSHQRAPYYTSLDAIEAKSLATRAAQHKKRTPTPSSTTVVADKSGAKAPPICMHPLAPLKSGRIFRKVLSSSTFV